MTENKSTLAMYHIYAAVSFICIGDGESSAKVKQSLLFSKFLPNDVSCPLYSYDNNIMQALDLIRPVYQAIDTFVGVREKTGVSFAYGLLLMRQQNLQEAR